MIAAVAAFIAATSSALCSRRSSSAVNPARSRAANASSGPPPRRRGIVWWYAWRGARAAEATAPGAAPSRASPALASTTCGVATAASRFARSSAVSLASSRANGAKISAPSPEAHWHSFLWPGNGSTSPNVAASQVKAPRVSLFTHFITSRCSRKNFESSAYISISPLCPKRATPRQLHASPSSPHQVQRTSQGLGAFEPASFAGVAGAPIPPARAAAPVRAWLALGAGVGSGVHVGTGVGRASQSSSDLGGSAAHWQMNCWPRSRVPSGQGCAPGIVSLAHRYRARPVGGISRYFQRVTSGWSSKNVGCAPPAYKSWDPVDPKRMSALLPHLHGSPSSEQNFQLSVFGSGRGVGMGSVLWQILLSSGYGFGGPPKCRGAQSTFPQLRRYAHFTASGYAARDSRVP